MANKILLKFLRTWNINWLITLAFRPKLPKFMIIVTGCYNSGTTLLQRILQSHPALTGIPPRVEGDILVRELPKAEDFGWRRMWHRCADEVRRTGYAPELAKSVLRQWRWWIRPNKGFVEKSVCDLLRLDFYKRSFGALGIPPKFIIIIRHPLPVLEGILRRATPMPSVAEAFDEKRYPAEMAAAQWKASARITLEQMECENTCVIRYEDLCRQVEATLQRICAFADIDSNKFRVLRDRIDVDDVYIQIHNDNGTSAARFPPDKWSELLQRDVELVGLMEKFGYSATVGDSGVGGLKNANSG